tara:strand:- start:63 stop:383 length:321 start_codon:yes stop_codon:yes gene_type:complete
MKKLSKKNQQIIDNVKDSIAVSIEVLEGYHAEGRFEMVNHCQSSIKHELSGICHYLIQSDVYNWDKLKDAFHEIQDMHELSLAFYNEIDDDELISEADYKKYIVNA